MLDLNNMKSVAQTALECLDLTDLSDHSSNEAVADLIDRGQTSFGHVAAICIWPEFVASARQRLGSDHDIKIATVVNFPSGDLPLDEVISQTTKAIEDGADEIDLVIPYKALKQGDTMAVTAMVKAVRLATPAPCKLKTIIETGELAKPDLIDQASLLAIEAGTDFIKTSTGKVSENATPEVAKIMLQSIQQSGKDISFKPAGGVKTVADAQVYLKLSSDILGADWIHKDHFRFGASSLLSDVIAVLTDKENDQISAQGY